MKMLLKFLKFVGGGIGLLALSIGCLLLYAPRMDGPILHVAGGPFQQASVSFDQLDINSLRDAGIIELEVQGLSRPSVTVGVLVRDTNIYIPATLKPEEKQWPNAIQRESSVRIRHGGVVISGDAHRVTADSLHEELSRLGSKKYDPSYFDPERTWFFRLTPDL